MPFRNPKYIIYASTELLDSLLAAILLFLGFFMLFPSPHIDPATGNIFSSLGGLDKWGGFFSLVGLSQLIKIAYPTKPHYIITEIIRHSVNFCYSLIALSLLFKYPLSPHSATYALLAIASFFSAARFDKREHY